VGKYRTYLIPRFYDIPRGLKITKERLKSLDIGEDLSMEERELFKEMLLNREGAIAFEWKDCSKVHEDISPLIKIKIVPHKV
jgi:hypothetical protein